jgi:hypothetical protein
MARLMSTVPNLVLVRECGDNAEASLVRALLQSRGISAVVRGENHRSMLGAVGAYIELQVLVPGAQRDEAAQLLKQFDAGELEAPQDDAELEPAPAIEGASCAVHHRPAITACARCGAFLCDGCGSGEGMVCTACESRLEPSAAAGRSRRRRWVAATLLFITLGGPVLWYLGYHALAGFFGFNPR